jgi:hypothetical protein
MPRSIARAGVARDHPGRVIRRHPRRADAPVMSNLVAVAYPDVGVEELQEALAGRAGAV